MIGGKGKRKKGKRKEVKRRGEGKNKEKKMLLSMLQYTSEMYHKKQWDEYDTETKAGSHIKACLSSDAFLRSPRGKSLLKSLKSYIVSQSPARRHNAVGIYSTQKVDQRRRYLWSWHSWY